MRLPMRLRLSASGHLYSAIASPSFLLTGRLQDRRANAYVGAAAAEIAAQSFLDLFGRRVRMLVEKGFAGDHKTGRAETALLRVVVNERLLNRVQFIALHQAFGGGDGLALRFDGEHRAGISRLAINDDRASAAGGAITNALRAGYIKLIAQGFEQGDARLDCRFHRLAVDRQSDWNFAGAEDFDICAAGPHQTRAEHQRHGQRDARYFKKISPRDAFFLVDLVIIVTHRLPP